MDRGSNKSTGQVEIRPATLKDREQILNIDPELWSGHDYLASGFYTIMHDPRIFAYVTLVDGEIVSNYLCLPRSTSPLIICLFLHDI